MFYHSLLGLQSPGSVHIIYLIITKVFLFFFYSSSLSVSVELAMSAALQYRSTNRDWVVSTMTNSKAPARMIWDNLSITGISSSSVINIRFKLNLFQIRSKRWMRSRHKFALLRLTLPNVVGIYSSDYTTVGLSIVPSLLAHLL